MLHFRLRPLLFWLSRVCHYLQVCLILLYVLISVYLLRCERYMGLWAFVLCIISPLRTGHCLGVGSLPFTCPIFPFVLHPWAGWCSYYATALLLLWYHLSFYLLLPLGLRAEAPTMSISYIHVNFLHYSFFWTLLPNIPARPAHSMPWASLAHLILWESSSYFILPYLFHSHGFFI